MQIGNKFLGLLGHSVVGHIAAKQQDIGTPRNFGESIVHDAARMLPIMEISRGRDAKFTHRLRNGSAFSAGRLSW